MYGQDMQKQMSHDGRTYSKKKVLPASFTLMSPFLGVFRVSSHVCLSRLVTTAMGPLSAGLHPLFYRSSWVLLG